jgi:hypothetical protein
MENIDEKAAADALLVLVRRIEAMPALGTTLREN